MNERSNLLKSRLRRDAPDKFGGSSCSARHEFHAVAPSLISSAGSSFAIVRLRQSGRHPGFAVALRGGELGLRQAFGVAEIGAGEVRPFELRQAQIGPAQIDAAQ